MILKKARKDIYYTNSHEWVDFQGSVAYAGICAFKLTGFKQIGLVRFAEAGNIKQKGDLVATISFDDYEIEARMPIDGKVVQFNEALVAGQYDALLLQPESKGWLALIVPAQPYERKDLLLPNQYQFHGRSK